MYLEMSRLVLSSMIIILLTSFVANGSEVCQIVVSSRETTDCRVTTNNGESHTVSLTCGTLYNAFKEARKCREVSMELVDAFYWLSAANDSAITRFENISKFHIQGLSGLVGNDNVVIQCESMTGLSFYDSTNISLKHVTLRSCGALYNSSSIDFRSPGWRYSMAYLEFLVALHFLFCKNVELSYISIEDSPGTGVVMYSTSGENFITYSNFTNNTAVYRSTNSHYPLTAGGGGLAVEFLYCIPGDTHCSSTSGGSRIPLRYQTNSSYTISNCLFENNNSTTGNYTEDSYVVPHLNYNVALGRGGGALILLKGNASGITVTMESCTVRGNSAVWGGGILVEFQDSATNNTVIVKDSVFVNNECGYDSCTYSGTGGGGARVQMAGFDRKIAHNSVLFTRTKFYDNNAYFGGGVSFFTFPEDVVTNSIVFDQVEWGRNIARLGSAVDMSVWQLTTGNLLKFVFVSCNFTNNTVQYTNKTGTPHGAGTVYIDTMSAVFESENQFINNTGSAIISRDGSVIFSNSATAVFESNTAQYGGAIALYNRAHILLNEQVALRFEDNVAILHGGAIYWEGIGNHELVSSRNCFIRYYNSFVDPTDWRASLQFINNSAKLTGNAIYSTTLLGCLWGGKPYGDLLEPTEEYNDVFCWTSSNPDQPIWNYVGSDCASSIATSPGYFSSENGTAICGDPYSFDTIPGDVRNFSIKMLDDRLSVIPDNSLIFSSVISNDNETSSPVQYTTFENRPFYGTPDETVEYTLSSIQPRIVTTMISLTFHRCPPGFQFNSSTFQCSGAKFPFILTRPNLKSSIQRGYWIGEIDDRIVVAQCQYCPFNPELPLTNYIDLPRNYSELDEYFCGGLERKGALCGRCKDGFAPAVNSEEFKCVKCSNNHVYYSWVLYLVTEFVPITVILALVIFFNISVTSGPLNSFVFFAQVISTTFGVDADGLIPYPSITKFATSLRQTYTSIYGVWNLNFYLSYDWALFCLGPNVTSLHLLALNFITAAYPLLVLLVIWLFVNLYYSNYRIIVCLVRPFHRLFVRGFNILNFHRSIMDAFATFLVLSYAKFAATSAVLLYPNGLYDQEGKFVDFVSKYDGTISFKSAQYAPFLITSVLVSFFICFLMPVLLFCYSIKPFYRFLEKIHFTYLLPGEKASHFLNAFHHCYKDGTSGGYDQRYFASIFFFIKFIIIFSYSYALNWAQQYVIQQVLCTVAITMICVFQPYKKQFHNIVDGCIFTVLAFINILTLYNRYLDIADLGLSASSYYIQIILIFSPSLYFLGYALYSLYHLQSVKVKVQSAKRRISSSSLVTYSRRRTRGNTDNIQNETDDFDYDDFMDDVTAEGRLYRHHYHGPLKPDELNRDVGDEYDAIVMASKGFSTTDIESASHTVSFRGED